MIQLKEWLKLVDDSTNPRLAPANHSRSIIAFDWFAKHFTHWSILYPLPPKIMLLPNTLLLMKKEDSWRPNPQ